MSIVYEGWIERHEGTELTNFPSESTCLISTTQNIPERQMSTQIEDSDETATVTTWTMQVRGLRRLPHRLVYNIADFSRLFWWSTAVVIPAVLLAVGEFGGGGLIYFYTMYCAVMMMVVSQSSERFVNTTIELDQDTGTLAVTYHMSDPTIFANGHEVTVSFDDVEAARFLSLAGHTMVRLYYGKSFAEGTAFLVPPDREYQFRDSLQRHNVSIRGESGADATGWVWGRCVVTALLLGAIPVSGVFIWPIQYSWAVLLVLVLHAIMLPMQGW